EIDRDDLEVTPDHVLVLKNAGPVACGMPEWGMLPVPRRLLRQGVRDMLRLSDARMSGTSYGACVLHISPEAAVGGTLAFVRTGGKVGGDCGAAALGLVGRAQEMAKRKSGWQEKPPAARGFQPLAATHIQQAHDGCDFDFLTGTERLPEP